MSNSEMVAPSLNFNMADPKMVGLYIYIIFSESIAGFHKDLPRHYFSICPINFSFLKIIHHYVGFSYQIFPIFVKNYL